MTFLPRLLALAAWAILALGAGMYVTGSHLAAKRFMTQATGPSSLPADSDYVAQVYNQRLSNDAASLVKASQILDLAGQREQSKQLRRFFAHCNVQRLGQEDACTRETVRSAVLRADDIQNEAQWPVDAALASKLNATLSLSFATEQQMRDGIDVPGFWAYHRYDSPGVLYDHDASHAFILLAAKNEGAWEIARFRARLTLPANHPIELDCDANPSPFRWEHPFAPATEVIRVCHQPEDLKLADLLAAVRQAQLRAPSVRLKEFELKDPYVRVTADAADPRHLTLHPVADFTTEFQPDSIPSSVSREQQSELKRVSCEETSTCPSQGQSLALALYDFFQKNYLLLPFLVGMVMGVGIGGLLVNSLFWVSIVAAAAGVSVIGGLVFAFNRVAVGAPGEARAWAEWGTLGIAVITISALLLWIPGLFLGFLLVKWFTRIENLKP
jgi:hypothetical protein